MKLGKRQLGLNYPPLVIVEIGINHGGSIEKAKDMVNSAFRSGAEVIKHQTHFVDDEMTEEAKTIIPPHDKRSIYEIMEKNSLSRDEEIELKSHVESLGMIYLSTPFSRTAADFLNDIGVVAFKIGSGECNHLPLIRHVCSFDKPVIMSTGMQDINTISKSVDILDRSGLDYALLECTNLYPSSPETVSLQGITELRNAFPKALIGFSDHSIGPTIGLCSIGLGACILERHFTLDRYEAGPDISCSMDPAELRLTISLSIEVWKASQNKKSRTKNEEKIYKFARGSVVADKNLKKGHIITERDIWARRPGTGEICVSEFDKVVGMQLNKNVPKNHQLKWIDLK